MEIVVNTAKVLAIDTLYRDNRNVNVPMVYIQSDLGGAVLQAPWLPVGPEQYMPMVGYHCLYFRTGSHDTRVICYYGVNGPHIRKGENGLNPGEAVFQSDSGGGFLKASQDGSVALVTGDAVTSLEGGAEGWAMKAPRIVLATFGGCRLEMTEEGTLVITRVSPDGTENIRLELDKDNNVKAVCQGDFSVKAKRILLDGPVSFGPGASDPSQEALFGNVVTAGPSGTHPFDFMTGAPIQGSAQVKSAR